MENVAGGELYDSLLERRRFPELLVNQIISQLLETVAYLHNCGIVHRDLKPENILLSTKLPATPTGLPDDTQIKITDFGLSRICGMDELIFEPCGTLAYVAPEVLTLKGYNSKVDIWSVGVIMYLLMSGRLPFPVARRAAPPTGSNGKDNPQQLHSNDVYKQLVFEGAVWDNVSSSAKDLLRKLLQADPQKRVSAQEALQHLWVKNPTAVITEGEDLHHRRSEEEESGAAGAGAGDKGSCSRSATPRSSQGGGDDDLNHLESSLLDVCASTFSVPLVNAHHQ